MLSKWLYQITNICYAKFERTNASFHRIRLHPFETREPIPDVQTTPQEWTLNPGMISKLEVFCARTWEWNTAGLFSTTIKMSLTYLFYLNLQNDQTKLWLKRVSFQALHHKDAGKTSKSRRFMAGSIRFVILATGIQEHRKPTSNNPRSSKCDLCYK